MKTKYKPLGQFIFDNHDLDLSIDDFLYQTAPLIGYIIHSFNSLDEELNSCICNLINDRADEPGALIIYKIPFSAKIDLFNRLVKSLEVSTNKTIPTLNSLINDLKKCGELRNAVVHAEWENMTEDMYTYVKMKFQKKE